MSLTPNQVAALREIEEIWPRRATAIIGATALGFYYDMTWRKTADVDLVVAIDFGEFPGVIAKRQGWRQHPKREHEFQSPQGVELDILPAGKKLVEQGSITWKNGHVMSLEGMDLAFGHAEIHDVEGGFVVNVAPPAVITVLKMASYCDRPSERERDLEDIAYLFDIYVDEESERRWDDAGECEEFELAPAYLLGLDIGRLTNESHRALISRFFDRVTDPNSVAHAQMQRKGPYRWSTEVDALSRRLQAFSQGLRSKRLGTGTL